MLNGKEYEGQAKILVPIELMYVNFVTWEMHPLLVAVGGDVNDGRIRKIVSPFLIFFNSKRTKKLFTSNSGVK